MSFAGDLPADGSGLDYSDLGAGQRKGAAQLPFMDSLADTAGHAFFGATRAIGDYVDIENQAYRARQDAQFNVDPTADPGGALIDPKEWAAQYPDLGLTFTRDMGRAQAQLLVDHRTDELHRQYVLDHSPDTLMAKTARGLTEFAVSALDPVNVAAAFVPGVGETRAGLWAAKYGKTFARGAEGAAAGATGMLALQPLDAAEAHAYQDHYGPMDAFMNVAFGTVLGGGLHAGAGWLSDVLSRAAPETREAALRSAVAQAAEGRPVDVEPVLATDPAITTVTETGKIENFPVINREDFDLAAQDAQHQQDIAGLDTTLAAHKTKTEALPPENPAAVAKLRDLKAVQEKLLAEDLTPEGRKSLGIQRDQILTDTTPEALTAQAQPTVDRATAESQRRGLQAQRDNSAKMLEDVRARRRQIAAEAALGPYARAAIAKARKNSLDYATGQEPNTATASPEASATAARTVQEAAGDDIEAEHADALAQVDAYEKQGVLTAAEATQARSGSEDIKKASQDGNAARATARCLLLHP